MYGRLRRFLVDTIAPQLRTINRDYGTRVRLDNAALLARRIYATGLGDFEAVWEREGRDVRRALARVIALAETARGRDPFSAVAGGVGR